MYGAYGTASRRRKTKRLRPNETAERRLLAPGPGPAVSRCGHEARSRPPPGSARGRPAAPLRPAPPGPVLRPGPPEGAAPRCPHRAAARRAPRGARHYSSQRPPRRTAALRAPAAPRGTPGERGRPRPRRAACTEPACRPSPAAGRAARAGGGRERPRPALGRADGGGDGGGERRRGAGLRLQGDPLLPALRGARAGRSAHTGSGEGAAGRGRRRGGAGRVPSGRAGGGARDPPAWARVPEGRRTARRRWGQLRSSAASGRHTALRNGRPGSPGTASPVRSPASLRDGDVVREREAAMLELLGRKPRAQTQPGRERAVLNIPHSARSRAGSFHMEVVGVNRRKQLVTRASPLTSLSPLVISTGG